jgi:colicin import membrane protein
MKITSLCFCLIFCIGSLSSRAQTPEAPPSLQSTLIAERSRISLEKARLEEGFQSEDRACYKKFLVNKCLDEVNGRRRNVMADLKRQETSLNEQERKAKAADQIFRTEQKSSLEKQHEAASLKDFAERMERDKQKNADRAKAQGNEKANSAAAAGRVRDSQKKVSAKTEKQTAEADEARKFAERQDQGKERRERHNREKLDREAANKDKPPSKPLPVPE